MKLQPTSHGCFLYQSLACCLDQRADSWADAALGRTNRTNTTHRSKVARMNHLRDVMGTLLSWANYTRCGRAEQRLSLARHKHMVILRSAIPAGRVILFSQHRRCGM